MFISLFQVKRKRPRRGFGDEIPYSNLKCDLCGKEYSKKGDFSLRDYHFCSKKCMYDAQRVGGVLQKKHVETCIQKYGVEHPMLAQSVKEKSMQTCLERYGNVYSRQSEPVRVKTQEALMKRFGVKYALQSEEVQQKMKGTCLERYGVEHVTQLDSMRKHLSEMNKANTDVRKETCLERYGCEHPMQSDKVKENYKNTMIELYGVEHPLLWEPFKEKFIKTSIEHYGTPVPMRSEIVQEKRYETLKRNGTYQRSKCEEMCYETLCRFFGIEDVLRQERIKRWPIDFYIVSINTYVQLDGIYWHGLDRPIDEIAEYKTQQDKQIHKKFMTDREQNEWFHTHDMKLVRVLDVNMRQFQSFDELVESAYTVIGMIL